MSSNVKGVFAHLDCLIDAIYNLKKAGYRDIQVASPLPRHEIEEQIYEGRPSPVRWWTLTGGILGGSGGFTLASLSSAVWPMALPGGKPVVSVPPFIVITFECTVLIGGLITLLALLYYCRLPAFNLEFELCDPRYSKDHFGLVLTGLSASDRKKAGDIIRAAGAVEVVDNTSSGQEAANG